MLTKMVIHLVTAATLCVAASKAEAANPHLLPNPAPHDGRYYEVVLASGISWENAKAAAAQRTFQGIQGHLVTIGSSQEDALVHQLSQQVLKQNSNTLPGTELWVGGHQLPCATTTPEPACGWIWINGEPISPTNTASPYTNWLAGQPDNLASADHLAIGLGGKFGWNDEGDHSQIWGYVVEYGDKIPATSCTAERGGCNPTGGQLLTFPPNAKVANNATLSTRTTLIQNDANRCGKEPLPLFPDSQGRPAVTVPKYLCGHPDFLVIESHTSGVEVPAGTIEVENLTEEVLRNLYRCDGQTPAGLDPDPSHRDVAAWQATERTKMLEDTLATDLADRLGTDRYKGSLAEVTYACGSSRAKIVPGSYQFIGLRIHPGEGNEYPNEPGNHESFVDLIRYKLLVLEASVDDAKPLLPGASYVALRSHVKNAIQSHDKGQYDSALQSIQQFLKEVAQSKYRLVAGENPSGEHIMRGSNLEFMYTEKLLPFAP